MKNKEWLKSLNDIELAKFLNSKPCSYCSYSNSHCYRFQNCIDGIVEWLNEEKKEK